MYLMAMFNTITKLIHNFRCSSGKDMLLSPFADKTRFFKETQEGVERMCKVMEEMMEERLKDSEYRKAVSIAVNLLKRGKDTVEEIAELTGLTVERVKEIEASLEDIPA